MNILNRVKRNVTGDPAFSMYNLSIRSDWQESVDQFCHRYWYRALYTLCTLKNTTSLKEPVLTISTWYFLLTIFFLPSWMISFACLCLQNRVYPSLKLKCTQKYVHSVHPQNQFTNSVVLYNHLLQHYKNHVKFVTSSFLFVVLSLCVSKCVWVLYL